MIFLASDGLGYIEISTIKRKKIKKNKKKNKLLNFIHLTSKKEVYYKEGLGETFYQL